MPEAPLGLLGAPGLTTRSRTLLRAPGIATRSKKLLVTGASLLVTRSQIWFWTPKYWGTVWLSFGKPATR